MKQLCYMYTCQCISVYANLLPTYKHKHPRTYARKHARTHTRASGAIKRYRARERTRKGTRVCAEKKSRRAGYERATGGRERTWQTLLARCAINATESAPARHAVDARESRCTWLAHSARRSPDVCVWVCMCGCVFVYVRERKRERERERESARARVCVCV